MKRIYCILIMVALAATSARANGTDTCGTSLIDTLKAQAKRIYRLELDVKPAAIIHTSDFLKGANPEARTMNHAFSAHLKCAFAFPEQSYEATTYGDVYQGIGIGYNELNPQLGNPFSAYIFQGARIARLSKALSLNYEWNLGLAFGWNPYDQASNPDNILIGSKTTAYIALECYLSCRLARNIDFNIGGTLSHYSNGNTTLPNYGLNTGGIKASLAYYINRKPQTEECGHDANAAIDFKRGMTYDLIIYGAWRQRGTVDGTNDIFILPDKYPVVGFSFQPLYSLNPWLKVGGGVDGVFDRSAYPEADASHTATDAIVYGDKTSDSKRIALGISARTEFTMPYFSINIGIGENILKGSDYFDGLYETLALKTKISRHLLLHIGYSLHNFNKPNHLMLGVGWRFGRQ